MRSRASLFFLESEVQRDIIVVADHLRIQKMS